MGIPGLWDILGDGAITDLAELSSQHYKLHKRPLRIAVDEAGWRFTNLTPPQVEIIREKEPAVNPIEKAILHRIMKLRKMNNQLLFVFDGPRRPHKRGIVAGRVRYDDINLIEKMLNHLEFHHTELLPKQKQSARHYNEREWAMLFGQPMETP